MMQGRGTVATGRVEQGIIKVGDEVEVLGLMQVCSSSHFLYLADLLFSSFLWIKLPIADFFCCYIFWLPLMMTDDLWFVLDEH